MCKKSSYHCNNIQKGFSSLASYYTDMNWTSIATQQVYIKKTIFATIIWLDYYRLYRNKFGYMSLMAHCNTMQLRPTRHHCITPIKSKVVDFKMKKKKQFSYFCHPRLLCTMQQHLVCVDRMNKLHHFAFWHWTRSISLAILHVALFACISFHSTPILHCWN